MSKVVYIIPGFGYSPRHKEYVKLAEAFKENGFKPKVIKINWYRRTMEDYLVQFMEQYKNSPKEEVTLLGFSLGANITLLANEKAKPKNIIFCSLSPYFKEDKAKIKDTKYAWYLKPYIILLEFLVSPAIRTMKHYSFKELSSKINCRVFIFAGKNEMLNLLNRAKEAHKKVPNSKLVLVENTGHDIGNKEYLKALKAIISKL